MDFSHNQHCKLEIAELLLITDNQPIKEIAYDLGYNDHSYFIRLLKKITGITPMAYRKSMR
ncbi:AraC family transcriptional regulator [Prevotella sp. AM42-24]|uniref:AraC family transcriptional regulator n=1 Tax=Segatella hominis TaxID=2518605 RepID=A0A4Y8VG57_9BACT|nr:AraC family transcriptional regulator [Prevotella sp. AM42-24]TFH79730.1 AraC family transcriptional regulator [Segatella hominis]